MSGPGQLNISEGVTACIALASAGGVETDGDIHIALADATGDKLGTVLAWQENHWVGRKIEKKGGVAFWAKKPDNGRRCFLTIHYPGLSCVSSLSSGTLRKLVSSDEILALAKALRVTVSWLYGLEKGIL